MKFFIPAVFIILAAAIGFDGYGQYLGPPKLSGVGLPYFNTQIFPTFSEDGAQRIVRVYIQMLNDDITFISSDDGFNAEIQIDIYISDQSKDFVFNRTQSEIISVMDFEETNSRELVNMFSTEIPIDSGGYEAVVTVLDKNSGKQVNRKVFFELTSFSEFPFLISDVLIFDKFEKDSTGRIVDFMPNLTGNFSKNTNFVYLYFQTLFKNSEHDSMKIRYIIKDASDFVNQQNEYSFEAGNELREHFIRLSRHQFERTRYTVQIIATAGKYRYKMDKFFSFFWTISPSSPRDIDQALRQLEYLADRDSIEYYIDQPFEAKQQYFERFWKEMDPNPETNKNELMDEYYRRVNFANQNYSTMNQEGWLTDRGRIFIKFGQPDDIERHPFEINTYPYEIWRYYSLRKVFLFIDRLGFGNYYLHPAYLEEEYN